MPFLRPLSYFEKRFHEPQEDAWLAFKAGRDLYLPWGRRSGKSDLIAEIHVEDAEETGYPSLVVAVTQKQVRRIFWKKFHDRVKHVRGWKANESRLEFTYKGGPSISLKGADLRADDLAGGAYRIISKDEYALWKKPEIGQQILTPMLADYDGQSITTSTKRGRNHFWAGHQEALKRSDRIHLSEATMFDNPFISERGRAKLLEEYPGGEKNALYQQEILNRYVVFEGQVFALPEESYTERRWDPGVLEHCYHWRGMDHGYSPDPTAAIWIAYDPRQKRFQVYNEYKQGALLIRTHADAIAGFEPYRARDTWSDVDPQVIAEYEAVGLPLAPAEKVDKEARLLRLVNALQTGKLKIAHNCTELLTEMASLTWEQVRKDEGDDHLTDALRYAFTNLSLDERTDEREPDDYRRGSHDYRAQDFGD